MGIYSNRIFPYILDLTAGRPEFDRYRREALSGARGLVLEVGFGTGLNLRCYPEGVERIVALDVERMLPRRVRRRIEESGIEVEIVHLDAQQRLPFADESFDTVVTTLTLCSIPDPLPALAEMRRVLKAGGEYLFFEHGRSDDPQLARFQDRINPLQRIIGAGCNLNRPIGRMIEEGGFEITRLDRFLLPGAPRSLGEIYRGAARRSD